jgi:hypothetical protein
MQLSYEEAMKRIDEYEKTDPIKHEYCREKKFPYHIAVYKGENQIIVVPSITNLGWHGVEMAWFRRLDGSAGDEEIGETVMAALEHICVSPIDARNLKETEADDFRKLVTKCKSVKAFNRKYLYCAVIYNEDGSFYVGSGGHCENQIIEEFEKNGVNLPKMVSASEIGECIAKNFELMEKFYNKTKIPAVRKFEFETISETKVSFEIPQGDNYTDEQDCHAAEIYQVYSYRKENIDEPIAYMAFSIAAQFDCNMSKENIRRTWEKFDDKATEFKIEPIKHLLFDYRAEMLNENCHNVMYFRQVDKYEIFACELTVKYNLAKKQPDKKITEDFEKMVKSSRIV